MAFSKHGALIERVNSTATSAGTLTLANNSQSFQRFTGTTTHTVVLPAANAASPNECPVGLKFVIMNRSTGTVTVNANGGGLIATVSGGSQSTFRLTDNSTAAGAWDATVESSGGGGSATLTSAEKLGALSALAGSFYQDAQTDAVALQINPEEIGGNFWTAKASYPTGKDRSTLLPLNGFAYMCGGATGSTTPLSTVDRYSDDLNSWLTRTGIGVARLYVEGFASPSALYVAGGLTDSGLTTSTQSVQSYSDLTDSWTARASLPSVVNRACASYLGGFGYTIGGTSATGAASAINTVYLYDPTANAWYSRANYPLQVLGAGSFNNVSGDRVYAAGGNNPSAVTQSATNYFSPVSNSWTTVASMSQITQSPFSCTASGNGYVAGGFDSANYVSKQQRYSFDANLWVNVADIPIATLGFQMGCNLNESMVQSGGDTLATSGVATTYSYTPFSFFAVPLSKRSTSAPTSIFVAAALSGVVTSVPVRIRTDGTNWKNLTANVDSALKQGETFAAKFAANGSGYYNYELQIGLPTYLAATGGGQWVTKSSISAFSQNQGFNLYEFGYVPGLSNGTSSAKYDFTLDTFVASANNLNAKGRAGCWVAQGAGYVNGSSALYSSQVLCEKYSEALVVWTAITSTSADHGEGGAFSLNGSGYAVAGDSDAGTHTEVEKYNTSTNAWSSAAAVTNRQNLNGSTASLNGFGYAINSSTGTTNSVLQYNDASNAWVSKNNFPDSAAMPAVCLMNGRLHKTGGTGSVATSYIYNEGSDSWSQLSSMVTARNAPVGIVAGNTMLISSGNGSITSSEAYVESIKNVVLGAALRIG